MPENGTDVPYPPNAAGDASVLLELLVDKDGAVANAKVIEGSEPFAEHARTAVLAWRFVPAKRGDAPVAALIRARVEFHRDDVAEAASPASSAQAPAPAVTPASEATATEAPSAAEAPVEVTISGVRREVGQTTLSALEIREMPGAFGDPFRAVEALPGVTAIASGLPYFFVRGAPPNDTGYYVDGVRIPLLFHLGLGQGVVHPGLIERVDFFPSAAPARYGGSVGGIIVGQTRAPAVEAHGEANLRLVDAGALLETPFANGRGSALVAGRYGYPGPILSAVSPEIALGYWDYQARLSYRLGARDTLGLFGFGSHDYLASRSPSQDPGLRDTMKESFVSDFHRLDLRYDHETNGGKIRVALTGGYDSQGAAPTYVKNRSAALRFELEQRLAPSLRVRAGISGQFDRYRFRQTATGPSEPEIPAGANPPPTNVSAGTYGDLVWRVTPRVELVPGVRIDVLGSERANPSPLVGHTRTVVPAVSPRLASRIHVANGVAWLSNLGISQQYPSLRVGDIPAPILTVPGFPFGIRRLQTAAQVSESLEFALPSQLVLTTTGFYTRFLGLTDLTTPCFQDEPGVTPPRMPGMFAPPYVCPNNQPVTGQAFGFELLARVPISNRLSGWLSYTLSRTTREAHFLTHEGGDTLATVPSESDRTHVLNASLSYDLGRRWRSGSRFLFYTGTPYSKLDGSWPVPPYNAYRTAPFFRVDVRLEKRWRLGDTGSIAFVFEVQNATLSKESTSLWTDCEGMGTPQNGTTTCTHAEIGPLTIPSVGVEAFF